MRATLNRGRLEEDATDSNLLLEESQESNTNHSSSSSPTRYPWLWVAHFLLFSTAIVTILTNLHKETDCIQKHSYYCT